MVLQHSHCHRQPLVYQCSIPDTIYYARVVRGMIYPPIAGIGEIRTVGVSVSITAERALRAWKKKFT